MVTTTELFSHGHSAHIYEDKMFVFRGIPKGGEGTTYEVWCLDLGMSMLFSNL